MLKFLNLLWPLAPIIDYHSWWIGRTGWRMEVAGSINTDRKLNKAKESLRPVREGEGRDRDRSQGNAAKLQIYILREGRG